MKIASWNVNSVKARLGHLSRWLGDFAPDVALLQETKTVDEAFPREAIEDLGYNIAVAGQKTYNGVAILSKRPLEDIVTALPGDATDEQARYVEAFTGGVRVASVYVPNGQQVGSDKYAYKLAFLDRLRAHADGLLDYEEAFVLGGDYNVIPDPGDVWDPAAWEGGILYSLEERAAYRCLLNLGLTDAFRALTPEIGRYSWWDYRGGAWAKDHGCRIDHLLLSPQAADRLTDSGIDKTPRGWEKTSDHTPVWCGLAEDAAHPA
ncbi:MAG: exodeoxyribonuclease III [Alphaproteobacteria bacterium]